MYAINLFKLWLLWSSDTEAFLEGTNLIGEQAKTRKLWRAWRSLLALTDWIHCSLGEFLYLDIIFL